MRSTRSKILWGLVLVLVVIQFFRPEKNKGQAYTANDITQAVPVPGEVKMVLEQACYDCHSNNTRDYWYDNIQPLAWWLRHHVNEGKRELNFSEFKNYTAKRQDHKLEELIEQVREGEMPLGSYGWIHSGARLTDGQKETLIRWAENSRKIVTDTLP